MDFELHYTGEQEEFRQEVQEWLKASLPEDMEPLVDPANPTPEQYKWAREFRSKLGEKGWRARTWPQEYGGGGMSIDMASVMDEELAKHPIPQIYDLGVSLCAPAIMVWGTEEQKQRWLRPIMRAEIAVFQLFSEPDAGSDLAAIKTKTDSLPSGVTKNVALSNLPLFMVDATDAFTPETGLSMTVQISKDSGAFTYTTNSATELGNGVYQVDLTQTEMNADIIVIKATATGAAQRIVTIITT